MDFASYVHQYYGNGYLVYQESGEAGKVCADYMNKTVPKDEVGRVLEKSIHFVFCLSFSKRSPLADISYC